jgi:hypothetical protein
MTGEGAKSKGKESNTGPKRRNSEGPRGKETRRGRLGETDLSEGKERQRGAILRAGQTESSGKAHAMRNEYEMIYNLLLALDAVLADIQSQGEVDA